MMCLGNKNWSTTRFSLKIHGMVNILSSCYTTNIDVAHEVVSIKWNNANHSGVIFNVDGSCLGSPARNGFGGVLWNGVGIYLSGFSGYIHNISDILYAELFAIYHGLLLTKDMGITALVCYSDSLHCINTIKEPSLRFHVYVILIQDIKYLIEQGNVLVIHTLPSWGNSLHGFYG